MRIKLSACKNELQTCLCVTYNFARHFSCLQTDPKTPVMAPGDKEKKFAAETDKKGTVSYVKQQIETSAALAKKLKVKPMSVKMD